MLERLAPVRHHDHGAAGPAHRGDRGSERFFTGLVEIRVGLVQDDERWRAIERAGQRDALTLLDESGVIVAGDAPELLAALTARDWRRAFVSLREEWRRVRVVVCGHAILEKLLQPYKSLTAHALLLPLDGAACAAVRSLNAAAR